MLIRLRVVGFKNLVDVDVRFGPLTIIAGPNGVGKSNLFDAIRFLSLLADRPFIEAAQEVRGGGDPRGLFTIGGSGRMTLECDVLVPGAGEDDFGQLAQASSTLLTYSLEFRLEDDKGLGGIRLTREELAYVTKSDARGRLGFKSNAAWRDSVVTGGRRGAPFISTDTDAGHVKLHSDRSQGSDRTQRGGGRPRPFVAQQLPRTVLSSAQNAEETRTAVLLRKEMKSWRQLQLEPSALRRPDEFHGPPEISSAGAHLPATLDRLASVAGDPDAVYSRVANRLSELVNGVQSVRVDRDEGRRLLTFMMTDRRGLELPAASLSDGTLRFVALTVLEQDPQATGVLCLEEPENGIHPLRVEAMLRLLKDLAVDPTVKSDDTNPLRQVVVTTHSPQIVGLSADLDVVFARQRPFVSGDTIRDGLEFVGLEGFWRAEFDSQGVSRAEIATYLGATFVDTPGESTVLDWVQGELPFPRVSVVN